jgi:hypothetical protein
VTRNQLRLAVSLAALALACGCAASGPAFEALDPPRDKALVYIYRPELGDGPLLRFNVAVGQQRIVYLIRGGYFPYLAAPGETEFWAGSEGHASVTENLRAGHTYYLRGTARAGLFVHRPELEFVSGEEAEPDLEGCVLLPPAGQEE